MKLMRRYLLLAATTAMVVACSNEVYEEASGYIPSTEAIGFDVTETSGLTRANNEITGTEVFKDDGAYASQGFGVFASYTGRLKYEYTTVSPDFMFNQQVKWISGAWSYSPVKYWPNSEDEYVSFFAYAPYEATPNGTKCIAEFSPKDELGDPWLIYMIAQDPWSNTNGQVDLLYGVNHEGTPADYPWYNQSKSIYDYDDLLKFTFKHALACIGDKITIKLSSELNTKISGYATIKLNKLVIDYTNLTSKARLVLNSKNTPNWKPIVSGDITTTRTYTKVLDTPLTLNTTEQEISTGNGLFYIPLQVFSGKQQAVITIYYTVTVTNGSTTYDGEASSTVNLSEIVGKKEGLALTLTKDLDLAHVVYDLDSSSQATEPSYVRKN